MRRKLIVAGIWLVITSAVFAVFSGPHDEPFYLWLLVPGVFVSMLLSGNPHGGLEGLPGTVVILAGSWLFWTLATLLVLRIVDGFRAPENRSGK
jgi:hypothetical protein